MAVSTSRSTASALTQGRNIDAADVIALLREVYADGIGTREEADELIAFDHTLGDSPTGWSEFFAATVADHVVQRSDPAGIIDDDNATWLIGAISHGRRIATSGGFGAVMRALELARETSPLLAAYAIGQVRFAIIAGTGPAIGARKHFSRVVDARDVVLLGRILELSGGAPARPVSRLEAEALFDLHDAVAGASNDPAFADLFFRAIASHLLACAGAPAETRLVSPGFAGQVPLGAEDGAWLSSRIMRDGRPTPAEFSLLRLFAGGTDGIDPSLRRFLDCAA